METENKYIELMRQALAYSKKALKFKDVPICAFIIRNNKIIAKGVNTREKNKQAIEHAEIVAIRKACKKLKTWYLDDCEIVVTLEPCLMCAGAIINARIKKVVFGAYEEKGGAFGSVFKVHEEKRLNHNPEVVGGILKEDCGQAIRDFFVERRKENKERKENEKQK